MKILLTGATGFLGAALLCRCKDIGIDAVSIGHIPNDLQLSDHLQSKAPFDGCVHLATHYLPSHKEEQIPDLINSNVLFGTRVLDASIRLGCRWFINAASFWQHASDGFPVNLYSATKEAFQCIVSYYNAAYNLKTVNLELTDTYGENDPRRKLVNLWCKALHDQIPLPMSLGKQEIELVHKDDVVEAFLCLSQMLNSNDKRIIGHNETYFLPVLERKSLRETASVFEEATGKPLPIQWGARPERVREIMKIKHRGKPLPGWRQNISLKDGFSRVYQNSEIS